MDLFFSNIKKTDKKIAEMVLSTSYYFSVEPGENAKNLKTSNHIWEFLTDNGFKRNDLIINLGGGMVSDLGGFVASTYMRVYNLLIYLLLYWEWLMLVLVEKLE